MHSVRLCIISTVMFSFQQHILMARSKHVCYLYNTNSQEQVDVHSSHGLHTIEVNRDMGPHYYDLLCMHLHVILIITAHSIVNILWKHHCSWGTNVSGFRGSPLLTNSHPYQHAFISQFTCKRKKYLAVTFNSTFRYINDVLSINSSQFLSLVDSIYPNELEIKDSTDYFTSAWYLDVLLKLDTNGKKRPIYLTNGMISISSSSTSLTYVVIFQLHLHMVYIYRNVFDMQELARHTISF
jgi:hypothetical protein